jgi:O-antigen/teichoic acid export membrane protein
MSGDLGSRHDRLITAFGFRVLSHNRALEAMLVASQAAGILAAIVIARSVGPDGRGVIVTLTVWGQILGWLAALSLDKALLVLTSGKDAVASPDEGMQAIRLPVFVTSVLAVVASFFLGLHFFSSSWLVVALGALAVATAQSELLAAWLLAVRGRWAYVSWRLLQPTIYVALMVALAYVLRDSTLSLRTIGMGVAASASMVIPVVVALILLSRRWSGRGRGLRKLMRFAVATEVASILQYLNGRLDLLALTFLVSSAGLGYYSVGAALGQVTIVMASAGSLRGITGEAKSVDLVGIGGAIVLALVVIVASPFLVPLIFGASFMPAVPIARILAAGGAVNFALQGACGRLVGRRRPWMAVFSQGVGVAVFAVGIAAFHSLEGVAWSSVASFVVSLVIAETALRATSQRP